MESIVEKQLCEISDLNETLKQQHEVHQQAVQDLEAEHQSKIDQVCNSIYEQRTLKLISIMFCF